MQVFTVQQASTPKNEASDWKMEEWTGRWLLPRYNISHRICYQLNFLGLGVQGKCGQFSPYTGSAMTNIK
jgi:hypothetical protein